VWQADAVKVSQIWSYPVKSMVGQRVDSCDVSMLGIAGDRHWAVRDMERGGIRGAKRIGELMQFSAEYVGDGSKNVVITLPNGTTVRSDDAGVNDALSSALGVRVQLEPLPADGNVEHFRRGPAYDSDPMKELRGVFGRDDNEPLPDFSVFPPEVMEFESPPGTHYDCWPLMVMTTSAFAALRMALPESVIDERRFRPSIVVDGAEPGHAEFNWKGRTASVGSTVIEFLDPCPRCVMPTRRINESIPEDRTILRHIVRDLDQNLGVYARIVSPGSFAVGDAVSFQ
jgi:uncharacterized protein YcbX